MTDEPLTVHIDTTSELARLLSEAGDRSIRLTAGRTSYRGTHAHPTPIDAATFRETIHRLAGSWSEEDAERAIAYIHKAREARSRPGARP